MIISNMREAEQLIKTPIEWVLFTILISTVIYLRYFNSDDTLKENHTFNIHSHNKNIFNRENLISLPFLY